jgi:hypothetical protein
MDKERLVDVAIVAVGGIAFVIIWELIKYALWF